MIHSIVLLLASQQLWQSVSTNMSVGHCFLQLDKDVWDLAELISRRTRNEELSRKRLTERADTKNKTKNVFCNGKTNKSTKKIQTTTKPGTLTATGTFWSYLQI